MAKFQYRMQNILNVKVNLESQEKQEFAAAALLVREEKDKLEVLTQKRQKYRMDYQKSLLDRIDLTEIELAKLGIKQTEEKMKIQLAKIRSAEKNLEVHRKKLQELMQERKTQEKLKEHAFEDFLKEENAKEQKEIDELVSYKYGLSTQMMEEQKKQSE